MSDLGTMKFRIKEEIPRRASADSDRVTLAIIDAITFYGTHEFIFNQLTGNIFLTTASEESYGNETDEGAGAGYDDDLLGITDIFVENNSKWSELKADYGLKELRILNSSPTSSLGCPDYYVWADKQIFLSPIPNDAYRLRIDGIKDIGTPVAQASAETWEFFEPDGTTTLTDSYTNAWFTEGEELIRLNAKVNLAENVYRDDRDVIRLGKREQDILSNLTNRLNIHRRDREVDPFR